MMAMGVGWSHPECELDVPPQIGEPRSAPAQRPVEFRAVVGSLDFCEGLTNHAEKLIHDGLQTQREGPAIFGRLDLFGDFSKGCLLADIGGIRPDLKKHAAEAFAVVIAIIEKAMQYLDRRAGNVGMIVGWLMSEPLATSSWRVPRLLELARSDTAERRGPRRCGIAVRHCAASHLV